ncbi:MAG TPA: LamG-like jellyroll fold domain-containing protein, partial [Candidatus Limnocylindrales bacterium]
LANDSDTSFNLATWSTNTNGAWAVGGAYSVDNNTWTVDNSFVAPSGSGSIYWRSAAGLDQSIARARKFIASAGAVGATTFTQATLGADAGVKWYGALKPAPDQSIAAQFIAAASSVQTPQVSATVKVPMIGGAGGTAYRDAVLADTPVSYWRLGEADGPTAVDEMGANDATYLGSPTYGQAGLNLDDDTAVSFPGANANCVQDSSPTGLPTGSTLRSIEAWFSTTDSGLYNCVFTYGSAATSQFFGIYLQPTEVYVTTYGTDKNFAGSFNDGSPHHLVVVLESTTTIRVYVDGEQIGNLETIPTPNTTLNAQGVVIGASSQNASLENGFLGILDEVAIYDYALTSTQVQAHLTAASDPGGGGGALSPAVAPGGVAVAMQLAASTVAVLLPVIVPGPVLVAMQLVGAAGAVQPPSIRQAVTLALIAATSGTFDPKIVHAVAMELIGAVSTIPNPAVAPGPVVIGMQTIAPVEVVFEPSVSVAAGGQTVVVPLIALIGEGELPLGLPFILGAAGLGVVFAPAVTVSGTTVAMQTISPAGVMFQPAVAPGPVDVAMQAISSAGVMFQPAVAPGPVAVAMQLAASAPAVYSPTVIGAQLVAMQAIAAAMAAHSPTVIPGGVAVAMQAIGAGGGIFEPAITTGGVIVTLNLLANLASILDPTVIPGGVAVAMQAIGQATAAYSPALVAAVNVPLVSQPPNARSPRVLYDVALPLISASSAVLNPTVSLAGLTVRPLLIRAGSVPGLFIDAESGEPVLWLGGMLVMRVG